MSAPAVTAPHPPTGLAPTPAMSVESATSAAVAGDLDTALRHADAVLRQATDPAGRARGAVVLAAVLPHRGLLARSAELHRWVAAHAPASSDPTAAVALLGTGALEEGRRAVTAPAANHALPDLADAADALVAQGVLASVDGRCGAASSLLVRAVTALSASERSRPLGDTPAALYGLLALHRGEPELAGPVLDLALDADLGGPAMRRRHLLLRAWAAMAAGGADGVATALAGLRRAAELPHPTEPRDELVAVALEVALARREGHTRTLLDLWSRARQALLRHPVDLYCLLPVGELAIAAARLGEQGWVAPHVADATALLDALGRPASWSTAWHWARLQAALAGAAVDRDLAGRHVAALAAAAEAEPRAGAFARAAALWLAVRAGEVDADRVADAAAALGRSGAAWDGARLAGEAAVRTTDRRAMSALLACARTLQPSEGPPVPTSTPVAPPPPAPAVDDLLTPREREIAALVLEGLTQREIAGSLFLSARTVEHHVARIKERLGVASRAEMFARLRAPSPTGAARDEGPAQRPTISPT